MNTAEHLRLRDSEARRADWKKWGPYVSERAWGTVREDYSHDEHVWESFPFKHSHGRAYRWNEDGLAGFCNRLQNVCLTVGLWNGVDEILKERLFGLGGRAGNHGEDVKEYYYYLDGVPSHAYMKMLYKYPQVAFPYQILEETNRARSRSDPEYELIEALSDAFSEHRYFDVFVEYAKADEEDILCRITAVNRGPDVAHLHVLPHVFFRNTWSWGHGRPVPSMREVQRSDPVVEIQIDHIHLGTMHWYAHGVDAQGPTALHFTDNVTNDQLVFGRPGKDLFTKDAINEAVVRGRLDALNSRKRGTKAAGHFSRSLAPQEEWTVYFRLSNAPVAEPFDGATELFTMRKGEADAFYGSFQPTALSADERLVQRQAFAGLLWSKQFYHYSVDLWLDGDPSTPPLPEWRKSGRNSDWRHLYNLDVLSMPDKWEYPWYAAWDIAFHMVPTALLDPEWAKRQLVIMLREWYMHPSGQLPAYEWSFGDVNPPVHAWSALNVFRITRQVTGFEDIDFLERIFHKLLLNFTWWVNQKDVNGNNVFEGGFLGLDNIGVLNRSMSFPPGILLEQADGTSWMAMYCLNMLKISLAIAQTRPAYEDVATKFFEHFVYIAAAINKTTAGQGLWDEEDGFYYDLLHLPDGSKRVMRIRSIVGLIALFAVETIDTETLDKLPRFKRRMEWFLRYRPHLFENAVVTRDDSGRVLLSVVDRERLGRILERVLDPDQFLSDYGLRSMSKEHLDKPFELTLEGQVHSVGYEPAESTSGLFGGNSNWRGPVWFPINYLMIDALRRFHDFYGEDLRVRHPSHHGPEKDLSQVANDLAMRLRRLFLRDDANGRRPFYGGVDYFQDEEHWNEHILFYEYFHGDNGAGIGASHQTGWTALVANLIQDHDVSAESLDGGR